MIAIPKVVSAAIAALIDLLSRCSNLNGKTVLEGMEISRSDFQEPRKSSLSVAVRRCFKAARLFLDLPQHIKLFKILTSPEVKVVTDHNPKFMYKYLGTYLARSFSRDDRARILISHYDYLRKHLDQDFLRRVVNSPLVLWQEIIADSSYQIYLTFPASTHMEGDLSLIFAQNSTALFTLSFTIGPGNIVNLSSDHVMYIARIQGKGRGIDLIRQATKNCHDVFPPALLLAAAQAVAICLNIKDLIGIGAEEQISLGDKSPAQESHSRYDEFWMSMGAERLNQGMFRLPVPLPEKPLSQIKRDHRSRAVRKRQFKHSISDQVERSFRKAVKGATLASA